MSVRKRKGRGERMGMLPSWKLVRIRGREKNEQTCHKNSVSTLDVKQRKSISPTRRMAVVIYCRELSLLIFN